jgi:uncharacterized protein YcbK (DUF882 family)
MGNLTKNFDKEEFECPCCKANKIDINFVNKLQQARNYAEIPFHINSGYRCKKHNKEVGGVVDSAHLSGFAADIETDSSQRRLIIVSALIKAGFSRIEICPTWTHADLDNSKPYGMFLK